MSLSLREIAHGWIERFVGSRHLVPERLGEHREIAHERTAYAEKVQAHLRASP